MHMHIHKTWDNNSLPCNVNHTIRRGTLSAGKETMRPSSTSDILGGNETCRAQGSNAPVSNHPHC